MTGGTLDQRRQCGFRWKGGEIFNDRKAFVPFQGLENAMESAPAPARTLVKRHGSCYSNGFSLEVVDMAGDMCCLGQHDRFHVRRLRDKPPIYRLAGTFPENMNKLFIADKGLSDTSETVRE